MGSIHLECLQKCAHLRCTPVAATGVRVFGQQSQRATPSRTPVAASGVRLCWWSTCCRRRWEVGAQHSPHALGHSCAERTRRIDKSHGEHVVVCFFLSVRSVSALRLHQNHNTTTANLIAPMAQHVCIPLWIWDLDANRAQAGQGFKARLFDSAQEQLNVARTPWTPLHRFDPTAQDSVDPPWRAARLLWLGSMPSC